MNLSAPFSVVTTSLDGPVLTALALAGLPASGREVHRLCGTGSPGGVHKVLQRLVRQGIVEADQRAAETLYTLNRRHLAAEAIEWTARIPERLVDNIREVIRSWRPPPAHASLYGSFARGTSDEDSDLDLLLVRQGRALESWSDQVVALQTQARAMTGNDVAVLEWSVSELRDNRGTPLVRAIQLDHVHLAGRQLASLLRTSG